MQFQGTKRYVATEDLQIAVQAAVTLERPLLIKGEPGTGKTLLAGEVSQALGKRLISWHIKSTSKAQQGLYEYDAVSRLRDSQLGDEKVHDIRNYRNLDDSVELGTRNIKVALKRLRKFARTGADEELDLDDTIRSIARNAGLLDLKLVPERHNAVKALIFFDVGGSMYPYVRICEELFSATRSEFKNLQYFYFHNFLYDFVWEDNCRRNSEVTPTWDIIHKFQADYKIVFVGDAAMAPYEIASPGGNIEYINEEPGETWMRRMTSTYPKLIWLNPTPQNYWNYTHSIDMVRELIGDRMFPLTLNGLDQGMRCLSS